MGSCVHMNRQDCWSFIKNLSGFERAIQMDARLSAAPYTNQHSSFCTSELSVQWTELSIIPQRGLLPLLYHTPMRGLAEIQG